MSLLDDILEQSRANLEKRKQSTPLAELEEKAKAAPWAARSFAEAVSGDFCVIAEYKRKSPSKGEMDAANLEAAAEVYANTYWIKALSVLTDEAYFDGSLQDLANLRSQTDKPLLRKDFIYDPYQVVEARAHGADALLLMTQVFEGRGDDLKDMHELAIEHGMDVLVEVGMSTSNTLDHLFELIPEEAQVVGINARKIPSGTKAKLSKMVAGFSSKDFTTDLKQHTEHRSKIPEGKIAIAESGIHTGEQLQVVKDAGYNAALVGTAFLTGPRPIAEVIEEFDAVLG